MNSESSGAATNVREPRAVSRDIKPGKQGIGDRFALRCQAERYRDRFLGGRHLATHKREVSALTRLLSGLGKLDTVLDVASGTGRLAPVFAEHARTLLQNDLSLQMLRVSQESRDLPANLGHVQGDARRLPLASNSADLVFCHRLLNHLPKLEDRKRIMEEMARVSRRFVTVSCLTPLALLRAIRRMYAWLSGHQPIDGFVGTTDLLCDAGRAGLRLVKLTPIRSGIRSAAFLTFEKAPGNSAALGPSYV